MRWSLLSFVPPLAVSLAVVTSLPTAAFAGATPQAGWSSHVVDGAAPTAFTGGMDFLPNGNVALFDGNAIVEVSVATGTVVQTIYTPPSFVFGSFVKTDPGGTFLLFGESLNHDIFRVPLDGSPASVITNLVFNFDATFESSTVAYVSAAPGGFGSTQIVRVDLVTGATDVIADLIGPSGPVAVSANGSLYYGESTLTFPAPVGAQNILRYSAAQVASAIGPTSLTSAQATIVAPGQTSPFDLLIDDEGDFFVSDGNEVRQYGPNGGNKGVVATEGAFSSIGVLASIGTSVPGRFDAFQPSTAGTLAILSTDFSSFNHLTTLQPARPTLTTTPVSPIPDGAFQVDLTGYPSLGMALLFVAANPMTPEVVSDIGGTSYFLGVDLSSLALVLPIPTDVNGAALITGTNGPVAGTAHVQAFGVTSAGFGVGTSNPLSITLQ